MRETTYKCDRCGAEDKDNSIDLERVGIHVGFVNFGHYTNKQCNNDWCKKCREEFGLVLSKEEMANTKFNITEGNKVSANKLGAIFNYLMGKSQTL
jgi:hypothetical protein